MSEINTGGEEAKKGKPKKIATRVDFTPMVDMNMLLITFFMFCTSLAKPQTMEIVMPTNDVVKDAEKNKVKDSHAISVILGGDDKVYYYLGKRNVSDPSTLKTASYGGADDKNSIRSLLLERNKVGITKVHELKLKKYKKQITEDFYKQSVEKIKDSKDGQVVMIIPTDKSNYKNLIDALDEMSICSIGKYAIVQPDPQDLQLVKIRENSGTGKSSVKK